MILLSVPIIGSHLFTVIKAECLSIKDASKGYSFPDDNDDVANFKGKSAHLMIPSNLLQNIFSKLPRGLLIRSGYRLATVWLASHYAVN